MQVAKYFRLLLSWPKILLDIFFSVVIMAAVGTLLHSMAVSSQTRVGFFSTLMMTLQSTHNQLYFFLPIVATICLFQFRIPNTQTFFRLINNDLLNRYIQISLLHMLALTFLGIIGGTLVTVWLTPAQFYLDTRQLGLFMFLLLLHVLGLVIYWDLLITLSLFIGKLFSWGLIVLVMFGDYLLSTQMQWSFFFTNGLTMSATEYGTDAIFGLILYIGYLLLLPTLRRGFLMRRLSL